MSPEPPRPIVPDPALIAPNDPPPPYPSRDRRHRRRRPTVDLSSADSEDLAFPASTHAHPDESTPLLGVSSPTRRTRTMSLSSGVSVSPSLAQTVVSAFRMDLDSEVEEDGEETRDSPPADAVLSDNHLAGAPGITRRRARGWRSRWRHYFRPIGRRAYWSALLHLLAFNFFYALFAWIYLFVFTLVRDPIYPPQLVIDSPWNSWGPFYSWHSHSEPCCAFSTFWAQGCWHVER
jgi:hypothetical protein